MASNGHNSKSNKQLEAIGLKRCPFNSNHILKTSKYQIHVFSCYSNMNTTDRNKWKCCQFNACHYVMAEEYETHLMTCIDNQSHIIGVWEQTNKPSNARSVGTVGQSEIEIKEEKTEEVAEPSVKPQNKIVGDWFDPEVKDYNIYQKPMANTAEEYIKDDKYWSDNKGYIDSFSYSALPKSERKKLNNLMLEKLKEKTEAMAVPLIRKHVDLHFTYQPITKVVKNEENYAVLELCNPVLNYLRENPEIRTQTSLMQPMAITEGAEDTLQPSLHKELHSINSPINYRRLVLNESTYGHENEGSALATALRSINLATDEKPNTVDVTMDKPFRYPRSCPFLPLRKPKATFASAEAVPEIDDN